MPEYKESPGAVWVKHSEKGDWLSITIKIGEEKHNFVAFANKHKKGENSPDYWIQPPRVKEDVPF